MIKRLISEYTGLSNRARILDVGCGEGYYAINLGNEDRCYDVYAVDNVKDAVVLGAKNRSNVKWIVGDLANIPVSSKSMDIILNIFAPSNYKEFNRIICNEGYVIKVVPGEQYLIELREKAQGRLISKKYSNAPVLQHFKDHMTWVGKEHLSYVMPVNRRQIQSFAEMTPMMFNIEIEDLILNDIVEITLDFEILIGRREKFVASDNVLYYNSSQ